MDSMALCKCKTRKIAGFCNANNMHIMSMHIYIYTYVDYRLQLYNMCIYYNTVGLDGGGCIYRER